MLILALDTAINSCSVTISRDRRVLSEKIIYKNFAASEIILPLITNQLRSAKVNFKDLELIAITRGPGSYTGVRVGLAVAKGLSIGLNIPIIGISSLQILATEVAINIQEKKDIICVNKARADELFFQEFKSNGAQSSVPKKIKKKTLVSIVENREVIITGNFVDELGEIIFESDIAIYKNNPSKFSPSNLIVNFVSSIIEKNDSFSNYPYDPIYLNSIK